MNEINLTKSQQQAVNNVTNQLQGNYLTPSPFNSMEVQGRDHHTGSLRVLIKYDQHTARVWIGKGGQIRDLDGMVLSRKQKGLIRMFKNPPSIRAI